MFGRKIYSFISREKQISIVCLMLVMHQHTTGNVTEIIKVLWVFSTWSFCAIVHIKAPELYLIPSQNDSRVLTVGIRWEFSVLVEPGDGRYRWADDITDDLSILVLTELLWGLHLTKRQLLCVTKQTPHMKNECTDCRGKIIWSIWDIREIFLSSKKSLSNETFLQKPTWFIRSIMTVTIHCFTGEWKWWHALNVIFFPVNTFLLSAHLSYSEKIFMFWIS